LNPAQSDKLYRISLDAHFEIGFPSKLNERRYLF